MCESYIKFANSDWYKNHHFMVNTDQDK